MIISNPVQGANRTSIWPHDWVYYITTGFMFAAAALRAILVFQDSPLLDQILLLLAGWLLAFLANLLLAGKPSWLVSIPVGMEILLTLSLLLATRTDFFAFLFAIPVMQARQRFAPPVAAALIGLTTLVTFLTLFDPYGVFYALVMAVTFLSGTIFLIVYIGATHRAHLIQDQQQDLVLELQQANSQLESYAQQLQQLAVGRERQRLARELHDSVTQTIFSMTLTTQSALLLLNRDLRQVAAQLERLNKLAQRTLAEMQILISKLIPENLAGGGFVATLQQHLVERNRLDGLSINLDVEGNQSLSMAEEQSLFRIAQEALNNVVKHARVSQAILRLHLAAQFWMEIEDQGIGFNPQQIQDNSRLGLINMRERAAEIGWNLSVESAPGSGTRIRVEKDSGGELHHDDER